MVTEKMVDHSQIPLVVLASKLVDKHFDGRVRGLSLNSSQSSKKTGEKDTQYISFSYEGKYVPAFMVRPDYASVIKRDCTEILGKEPAYLKCTWDLSMDEKKNNDSENSVCFSFKF